MSPPSLQTLQTLANETGFQPDVLEKTLRHIDLLQEFSRDAVLSDRLALKGGTALNHFYLAAERLSVDIDLNFVGSLSRESMISERPEVEAALRSLLSSQGYNVRRLPDSHAGGKWVLRYSSVLGFGGTLSLDLNYMARQPLFGTERMSSHPLGDIQVDGVLVLDIHEIIAGKIVALIARNAARDLFDARRILSVNGLDWGWIKAAVLAIGACSRFDWRTASVDAITADLRDLRRYLATCLPSNHPARLDKARMWIDQTLSLCRENYGFLFNLSRNEQEFLDCILDRGEIYADLLDVDPEIQARIGSMPILAWKSRNVRKYRPNGRIRTGESAFDSG